MTDSSHFSERLRQLIHGLNARKLDAFVQPINDEFQGEYTPQYAQRLTYISGFSGSAGMGAFFCAPQDTKHAALFVDGRYTIQVAQEVSSADYHLLNSGEHSPIDWLCAQLGHGARIAYDPWLHTHAQIRAWKAKADKLGVELIALSDNPIDAIWQDQPSPPAEPIEAHSIGHAGQAAHEKVAAIVRELSQTGADAVLLALPDGINWMLNVRGGDIPFNPLVLGFALVEKSGAVSWFIRERVSQFSEFEIDVTIYDLNEIDSVIKRLFNKFSTLQLDVSTTADWFFTASIEAGLTVIEAADPTLIRKACKNATELNGMRAAHRRDGKALSAFLVWLKEQNELNEMQAAEKLEAFRREMGGNLYRGKSFETISGAGPNGAIVHYRASEASNRKLEQGELFLLDSGAQYSDGTTDVTRTVAIGTPSKEMIDRFTRVLKGHIAVARARFPEGTSGTQLDPLARQYLWEIGCDYDHGTGHGVGAYLCVHEGPQRISKRGGDVPLLPGMVLSNEPGYYKAGEYGIRIENLVMVIEVGKTESGEKLLGFETLTLAPIDTALIDANMLSPDEAEWLADYHAQVAANNAS